ncbi:MAG TPA: diaminopimelate epimerase [Terriglobales bacterium]|nr:diaminopimelate epimerase [Terriglobales bacterium]
MPKPVPFVKATACGNDFLLIERKHARDADLMSWTRKICDRHCGVGADGVEWLSPGGEVDVAIHLLNADGSEAEISGNGTRCVAAWLADKTNKRELKIRTGAGLKTCTLISQAGKSFEFRTAMGKPEVAGEISLRLMKREVSGIAISMGNPHFVMFVDDFPKGWQAEAAEIGVHAHFPQGTNVELVKVIGFNSINIRIFERGAGETESSGTGSCASAVASIHSKRVKSPVKVVSPGGPQTVEWEDEVFLTGPAQILCGGEFYF